MIFTKFLTNFMKNNFLLMFILSTALFLLLVKIDSSHPLLAASQYPIFPNYEIASSPLQEVIPEEQIAPNLNISDLVCYMQTADGKVMNLISLCKEPSAQNPVQDNINSVTYICDPQCRPVGVAQETQISE